MTVYTLTETVTHTKQSCRRSLALVRSEGTTPKYNHALQPIDPLVAVAAAPPVYVPQVLSA